MGYMGYGKTPYAVSYLLTVWYGKNTVYDKVRLRYGTMVRCHGVIMAKFAWWYSMFQYIRCVMVEYVERVSSVTTLYIDHCKVFENISLADRQTDRQTNMH